MDELAEWDHLALHWINSHHHPVLDWILVPVSFLGEGGWIWILTGLILIIAGRGRARATGIFLLVAMLLADRLAAWTLGAILQRTRPYLDEPGLRQIGIRWAGNSFPSAHAHSAVIAAIVLGSEYRRLLPVLIAFALLTLYSRPYLGMHYPLDIVVGALVGVIVGFAAILLRRHWRKDQGSPVQR